MSSKVVYLNHKNKPKRRCIETGSGHRGVADVLAAMWTFDQQVEAVSWKRRLRNRVVSLVPSGGKSVTTTNNITDL